ncbi:hypothetical protein CVT26_011421 [Gymnopilus dilepis]|uniref:Uncharacterized protein n=1 Tax=Gymnopilus dilepis TaxID=231916 RepID=A0A409W8W1_9AGAR|nr:hypothetical protein CVT26_011421 [Gymnopilus dilepis]
MGVKKVNVDRPVWLNIDCLNLETDRRSAIIGKRWAADASSLISTLFSVHKCPTRSLHTFPFRRLYVLHQNGESRSPIKAQDLGRCLDDKESSVMSNGAHPRTRPFAFGSRPLLALRLVCALPVEHRFCMELGVYVRELLLLDSSDTGDNLALVLSHIGQCAEQRIERFFGTQSIRLSPTARDDLPHRAPRLPICVPELQRRRDTQPATCAPSPEAYHLLPRLAARRLGLPRLLLVD